MTDQYTTPAGASDRPLRLSISQGSLSLSFAPTVSDSDSGHRLAAGLYRPALGGMKASVTDSDSESVTDASMP